jgi:hypothetical protein
MRSLVAITFGLLLLAGCPVNVPIACRDEPLEPPAELTCEEAATAARPKLPDGS